MVENIFEVQRQENGDITFRIKPPMLMRLSEPTKGHLLSAQREILLAMRSALDGAIEKTEELQRSRAKKQQPHTKIEVQ